MTPKPEPEPEPEPGTYTQLPPSPGATQTYVILHLSPPTRHPNLRRHLLLTFSLILFLSLTTYLLFPSDPRLKLVRVKLNHIRVNSHPHVSLDLSLSLTLRVFNPDAYALRYDALNVTVAYRGRELGFVRSDGGEVKMRGSSYVDATLNVDGFEVLHDIIYLVEDVANGVVPFDTISVVNGELKVLFITFPIKAKVSCEIDVNPKDQTITHQNCHPE